MARVYHKPMMEVEQFVANEYVASCSGYPDGTKVYKAPCDAGENGQLNGSSHFSQCDQSFNVSEAELMTGSYAPYFGKSKAVLYWASKPGDSNRHSGYHASAKKTIAELELVKS